MSQTIRCASCGAPATNQSDTHEFCEFCGSRFAPNTRSTDLFSQTQTSFHMDTDGVKKAAKPVLLVMVVVGALVAMGMGLAVFFMVADPGTDTLAQTLTGEPSFAEEVQRIGGEGNGAGKFTDNREVGIDGKGRIYSADYSGGRVQVFDAAGNFSTQWFIPQMPIQDMCVSREGTVYLSQQSRISAYDGATGKLLKQTENDLYGNMATLLDGSLVVTLMDGDMAKLDKDLNVTQKYEDVMQKAGAESSMTSEIAGNGLGEVFVLDFMGRNVYRFSPQFVFKDRFKTKGMIPNHIAVDDAGRIFVSSVTEINVYNQEGEFLEGFPSKQAFGMAFDGENNLWIADRPYLVKYKIK